MCNWVAATSKVIFIPNHIYKPIFKIAVVINIKKLCIINVSRKGKVWRRLNWQLRFKEKIQINVTNSLMNLVWVFKQIIITGLYFWMYCSRVMHRTPIYVKTTQLHQRIFVLITLPTTFCKIMNYSWYFFEMRLFGYRFNRSTVYTCTMKTKIFSCNIRIRKI